jgi:hypothetical protein
MHSVYILKGRRIFLLKGVLIVVSACLSRILILLSVQCHGFEQEKEAEPVRQIERIKPEHGYAADCQKYLDYLFFILLSKMNVSLKGVVTDNI